MVAFGVCRLANTLCDSASTFAADLDSTKVAEEGFGAGRADGAGGKELVAGREGVLDGVRTS